MEKEIISQISNQFALKSNDVQKMATCFWHEGANFSFEYYLLFSRHIMYHGIIYELREY